MRRFFSLSNRITMIAVVVVALAAGAATALAASGPDAHAARRHCRKHHRCHRRHHRRKVRTKTVTTVTPTPAPTSTTIVEPSSPTPSPTPAPSGSTTQQFTQNVGANQTETVTVGQFTLRENAGPGGVCSAPTLTDNSAYNATLTTAQNSSVAMAPGGGGYAISSESDGTNQMFSALLTNDSSQVSGDVTYQSVANSNSCNTSGSISGK